MYVFEDAFTVASGHTHILHNNYKTLRHIAMISVQEGVIEHDMEEPSQASQGWENLHVRLVWSFLISEPQTLWVLQVIARVVTKHFFIVDLMNNCPTYMWTVFHRWVGTEMITK